VLAGKKSVAAVVLSLLIKLAHLYWCLCDFNQHNAANSHIEGRRKAINWSKPAFRHFSVCYACYSSASL